MVGSYFRANTLSNRLTSFYSPYVFSSSKYELKVNGIFSRMVVSNCLKRFAYLSLAITQNTGNQLGVVSQTFDSSQN